MKSSPTASSTKSAAAVALVFSLLLSLFLPVENRTESTEPDDKVLEDPEVNMGISGRSGPICIEIHYQIPGEKARRFYNLMHKMQPVRNRNGANDWSLARNIADPDTWVESFRCPTWNDYLRLRTRTTLEDRLLLDRLLVMHTGEQPIPVDRWLERPSGSVRWREESPDRGDDSLQVSGKFLRKTRLVSEYFPLREFLSVLFLE